MKKESKPQKAVAKIKLKGPVDKVVAGIKKLAKAK